MMHKSMISLAAAFIGTAQALSHGELEVYGQGNIRWQQVGEGMFTGIPEDEWDDDIHKRSDVKFEPSGYSVNHARDLEGRNLQGFCQAIQYCATSEFKDLQLVGCVAAFVEAADSARNVGQSLWEFLRHPFAATVTGATVAGILSFQVNEASKPKPSDAPSECSTMEDAKDAILSALHEALSKNPDADSVTTTVTGPTTTVTITVTATPEGEKVTPKLGKCYEA